MPSAKQRGSKGGHGAPDKGAHPSGGADDVARKPPPAPQPQPAPPPPAPHPPQHPHPQQQQQQHPAHGRGGHRGGKSSASANANAAASPASCPRGLGRALNFLFYLALLAAAAFSGWCVHHVLEEVQQVRRGHRDFSRQREELGQGLQGVEQKVQSLQATFGTFESILRSSQHKQDLTEKVVKQGETEINRISEVLQKLQNEILKDLSDGIHVVKDARERDFTSLENTVEERLTELTKSINDNIAIFTEVQKRSQKEISDVKAKVASLEGREGSAQDVEALREAVRGVQASAGSGEEGLAALRSTVQSLESDVYTAVKELVSLQQEQQRLREALESGGLERRALAEQVLRAEEAAARLPAELRRLEAELRAPRPGPDALGELQRQSRGLQARLQAAEAGVRAARAAAERHGHSLDGLLARGDECARGLAALQGRLGGPEGLGGLEDRGGLAGAVHGLGEAQLALSRDVEQLKTRVAELPGAVRALQQVQEQVHALLGRAAAPAAGLAPPQDVLDRLSSLDHLTASVSQVEADLKMLRTAVDSLVAYSVKIESNENDLESAKGLLDDLRNDLDRLFVKVEKIHEKV